MLARYLAPVHEVLRIPKPHRILSPLNPGALTRAIHHRDTTCASRMLMDHGKNVADFQRVDAGIDDIAGTPDTAGDRRLTPV